MKIIAIVRDNAGAFHCAFVKNPDLFRREVASQTGGASLAYASAASLGGSPEALINQLHQTVLPRFAAAPSLQHDIGFLAAVSWCQRAPKFPQKWAFKNPQFGSGGSGG